MIEFRGHKAIEKCPYPLRRIEVYDPETENILVSFTNSLQLGATTITTIYKERWQIEILLETLKKTLRSRPLSGSVLIP
jgi:IS4 transposase